MSTVPSEVSDQATNYCLWICLAPMASTLLILTVNYDLKVRSSMKHVHFIPWTHSPLFDEHTVHWLMNTLSISFMNARSIVFRFCSAVLWRCCPWDALWSWNFRSHFSQSSTAWWANLWYRQDAACTHNQLVPAMAQLTKVTSSGCLYAHKPYCPSSSSSKFIAKVEQPTIT